MPPTTRCTATRKGDFSTATTDTIATCRSNIFAGEQLLCARLRPANIDAAAGSLEEVQRIVEQLRQVWPEVEILLRADSAFCRDEIMSWCEQNGVDYLFGQSRAGRLRLAAVGRGAPQPEACSAKCWGGSGRSLCREASADGPDKAAYAGCRGSAREGFCQKALCVC